MRFGCTGCSYNLQRVRGNLQRALHLVRYATSVDKGLTPNHCMLSFHAVHVKQVREEQAEAQSVATVVAAEEAEVAAKAAQCKALKDDAAAELVGTRCFCCTMCLSALCILWPAC